MKELKSPAVHVDSLPMKLGTTIRKNGVEFCVHSNANRVWLLLFETAGAAAPLREFEMIKEPEDLWHITVSDAGPGTFYLYRTDAVPTQWLLDPYAREVHFPRAWGEIDGLKPDRHIRTGKHFPKGVVIDSPFNWRGEKRPRKSLEKTIIYEAHLRGFTRSECEGTYRDFIGKIPYLKELGITAVEFLPLFEFNELEFFRDGDARKNLRNFWGYSTLAFFAPMSRYATSSEPGAAVTEFKTLVKALHNAGIEVILDVVFNHTAEGAFDGPTYSFRGLDEAAYYMINPDGTYPNWSGCGNTFNCNHPVARQFIVDCLKYWTEEMHVDGFRFDLATVLCRNERGELLDDPPVITAIETEPVLKKVKLIAEAWDLGGYQVGSFPGRFSEWNGRFRDDVRRFWNDSEVAGTLATRLAGNSDIYQHSGATPLKSINFITSHDGFTLADLVTYEKKHNEANGEDNRDGDDQNNSINFGIEGPTDDPVLCARRLKQQKNLLTSLFISRGVPMFPAGDEFGRTQQGNNNAYCQDNEISWIDWSLLEKNKSLFEFTRKLIALRKKHSVLRKGAFYKKEEVEWLAPNGREIDWHHDRALGMYIQGRGKLLILINNEKTDLPFELPGGRWKLALHTDPSAVPPNGGDFSVLVPAESICVFSQYRKCGYKMKQAE
ncbi:MAG: isoamylase [Verrucomicrobiota bacterium]|nr:isoamylase [Verrucomicrobiota bacterium]MDK2963029.1 isoamylase [Verrucomicrobiota bacterium]